MNTNKYRLIRVEMTRDEYSHTLANRLFRLEMETGVEWCGSWENGVATLEPVL